MKQDKSRITKIVDITLEIIYLLTGERYSLVKTASLENDIYPPLPRRWRKDPNTESPPPFRIPERNNNKMILKAINKMIELLTGEVPIRCQDVTVYFSMEEWEYIETHKDLYKDIMMENQLPLTSLDEARNKNPPVRRTGPLYSQDHAWEDHPIPQRFQRENVITSKVDVMDEDEMYVGDDESCKEVAIPSQLSLGDQETSMSSQRHLTMSPDYDIEDDDDIIVVSAGESSRKRLPRLHSRDRLQEPINIEDLSSDRLYTLSPNVHSGHRRTGGQTHTSSYDLILANNVDSAADSHGVMEPFFCPGCAKWFLQKLPPEEHQTITHKVQFSCPDCRSSLKHHEGLPQPNKADIVKLMHGCLECGKCFTVESDLFRHQRSHSGNQPRLYPEFKKKAEHQKMNADEGWLECAKCGERFSEKSSLLGLHSNEECLKCSGNKWLLHGHPKMEPEEGTFSEDGNCFTDNLAIYKHHERTFSDYKPFPCPECGKCYTSKSVLNRHMKLHSDYKPFPCPECGKCFANKSLLNSHRRVHTKPFSCSECGRCFTFKYHLAKHELTHMFGKPYAWAGDGGTY
ncbi:oocyte zinc finger protein XlCOF7.1-like [Hyperolius riggenbachi]|uniref:oocyte zinc finger protein XlCOF7.1-like n=1 Tax=Hyperolius riggenbachi TaxID=752182 RepID=UPI0035A3A7EA